METRFTLRPGQAGTRKLVERYGDRLVCVRYVYDVVYVRIAWHETELRERAKRLGAIWRHQPKLWEITFGDSKRLGIEDRIVQSG